MKYIIMAAGSEDGWNNYLGVPKQLIKKDFKIYKKEDFEKWEII